MPQPIPLLPPLQFPPPLPIQKIAMLPPVGSFSAEIAAPGIGTIMFPGINYPQWCRANRTNGTKPNAAILHSHVQDSAPSQYGNLILSFNQTTIIWRDCLLELGKTMYSTKGHTQVWKILDRRWRWQRAYVSGRFNVGSDLDDVGTRSGNVRYLMKVLLELMGETQVDLTAVNNVERPTMNWSWTNCATALDLLLAAYGYVITLNINDIPVVYKRGVGQTLPDNNDVLSPSMVFNPADLPAKIICVAQETFVETRLKLEPVGEEYDEDREEDILPVDELSYKPNDGWTDNITSTMNAVGTNPANREKTAAERKLAIKTVGKWYRIVDQAHEEKVNGSQVIKTYAPDEIKILKYTQYLPVSDKLNSGKAAYLSVKWNPSRNDTPDSPAPPGKNIEEKVFGSQEWTLDEKRGIVKFTTSPVTKADIFGETFADVYLTCSYVCTDDETGIKDRYTRELVLGGLGTDVVEYITDGSSDNRFLTAQYDDSNGIDLDPTKMNDSSVTGMYGNPPLDNLMDQFMQKYAEKYFTTKGYLIKYRGLQAISTDGVNLQVEWNVANVRDSESPYNTIVVQNMESLPGLTRSGKRHESSLIRHFRHEEKLRAARIRRNETARARRLS